MHICKSVFMSLGVGPLGYVCPHDGTGGRCWQCEFIWMNSYAAFRG